jgi:hypothetical protein
MGEVFRARDTKLNRDVALKTLPPEFSTNPDRLARFEREAMSLAALNHPHIASIYGIEEQDGSRFLVLELVEGKGLDEQLARGALPVKQALEITLQIAAAVKDAHDKGLIHRDLKPANIKITAAGAVKVLDFGLVKSLGASNTALQTKTALGTDVGLVMGTPPYMSPEQARGESAGKQSDIWSLGVILYEMLTGISPFKRDTIPGTLARVLEVQPDYAKLPASTPPGIRRLLRRCLEKELARRTHDMGDVRLELEDALAGDDLADSATVAATAPRWRRTAGAAALLALAAIGAVAAWSLGGRGVVEQPAEPIRLAISSLEQPLFQPFGVNNLAISDDGRRVAFAATDRIWVRELGSPEGVAIEGRGMNLFFSPDGEWIVFFGDGGLRKAPSSGGERALLHETSERPLGGMWSADGHIVFATAAGVFRIPENGGSAEALAAADATRGERAYAWPKPLPGGRHILLTVLKGDSLATAEIAVLDLTTGLVTPVHTGGFAAQYVTTGHLVYVAGQTLQAIEFDAATLTTRGSSVPVPNANIAVRPDSGAAQFAVASAGTLIFMPPQQQPISRSLVWADSAGRQETVPLEPGAYTNPRISPDGTRVALDDLGGASRDVWILDLERSAATRLTTSGAEDALPLWSADGTRVFFSSNRGGSTDIYSQAADGASDARLELGGAPVHFANSVTPDGTRLILYEDFRDLKALVIGTGALEPVLTSNFDERLGEVSPDGRWIAYESNESGERIEIFVRPFPNVADRREKASIAGGRFPRWGNSGNELYYVALDGAMMAAAIETVPSFRVGAVTKLFDWEPPPDGRSGAGYDVSPLDGRFLITKRSERISRNDAEIQVVLNWFTELERVTRAR